VVALTKLFHMLVKEMPTKSNSHAEYTIDKVDLDVDPNTMKQFLNEVDKVKQNVSNKKQSGGRKHKRKRYDDDDSSSSDEEDYLDYLKVNRVARPFNYWWYAPTIYSNNVLFTPTFISPISPYVQLWVPV